MQFLRHGSCLLFHFSIVEGLLHSIVKKWNNGDLFVILCSKNQLFCFSTEPYYKQKIIFARLRTISGDVNNSGFWETDPVYYFTSLLKKVSCTVRLQAVLAPYFPTHHLHNTCFCFFRIDNCKPQLSFLFWRHPLWVLCCKLAIFLEITLQDCRVVFSTQQKTE